MVLTSHGIQKRFQRMARDSKRVYTVKREIWLLSEDETLDCIQCMQKTDFSGKKADNSGKKADNSRIIDTKTKQSKAKQNNDVVVLYAREDGVSLTGLVDEGMELISAAYESNIGTISPLIAEQMREYRDKMEPECIVKAISTACDNGVRTWAYIRGILNNRLAKNVTTMREWEADETEWARQKSKGEDKKGRRAKSVTEIINELED